MKILMDHIPSPLVLSFYFYSLPILSRGFMIYGHKKTIPSKKNTGGYTRFRGYQNVKRPPFYEHLIVTT